MQRIQAGRTKHPSGARLNVAAFDDQARHWARELENAEARRRGEPVERVRPLLARRLGIAPGTFENLRRDRLKGVRAWVYHALRDAYLAERERQHRALLHDIERTKAVCGSADPVVAEVEALVAAEHGTAAPLVDKDWQ